MRQSFNSIPFVPASDAELQEIRQVLEADSRRPVFVTLQRAKGGYAPYRSSRVAFLFNLNL